MHGQSRFPSISRFLKWVKYVVRVHVCTEISFRARKYRIRLADSLWMFRTSMMKELREYDVSRSLKRSWGSLPV
jgi:hypothetical protein